jgi:hypothetical protein
VRVQERHIQQVRLEIDKEEGVGDHDDLANGQIFLQLRRLQQQSQPLEQLGKVIEEVRRLMLGSADTASRERLSRREAVAAATTQQKQQQENGADGKLQRLIWDPGGFPTA